MALQIAHSAIRILCEARAAVFRFLRRGSEDPAFTVDMTPLLERLDRIEDGISHIHRHLKEILMTIDDLKADVAAERTVIDGAIALINGFAAQLAAAVAAAQSAGATPAELQSLTDLHNAIITQTTALASAVTANTAPTAPATPTP